MARRWTISWTSGSDAEGMLPLSTCRSTIR
jgi:hypothetical protein